MKRILMMVFLLMLVGQPVMAQRYDASGTWKSTTGNTFYIPNSSKRFDIIITTKQGQRMIGKARWVKKGQSFKYTVTGSTGEVFVKYNSQYDALQVTGAHGTSWWKRS